ncbi:hypothetical protein [Paraburkholderia sp.]|uniref:hypothetical protein n=1 Tax=Paraburkholderia sp. TaxID=1926495 RepID=UPI0025F58E0E|nr:hypothetical protein [Paraburkholderia sp.]
MKKSSISDEAQRAVDLFALEFVNKLLGQVMALPDAALGKALKTHVRKAAKAKRRK